MLILLLFTVTTLANAAPLERITYEDCMSKELSSVASVMCFFEANVRNITIEEAEYADRTPIEHNAYCWVRLPMSLRWHVSDVEIMAAREELASNKPGKKFDSADEVVPYLHEMTPTAYAILMRFKSFIDQKIKKFAFGDEAMHFINSVESIFIEFFVSIAREILESDVENNDVKPSEEQIDLVNAKIMTIYSDLSESARKDLERFLCLRTFNRLTTMGAADRSNLLTFFFTLSLDKGEQKNPPSDAELELGMMVIEEAAKIGRTVDEHNNYCFTEFTPQFVLLMDEVGQLGMGAEISENSKPKELKAFNSTDEVLPLIRAEFPEGYAVVQHIKNIIGEKMTTFNFRNETTNFMNSIELALLEVVVSVSHAKQAGLTDDEGQLFVLEELKKVIRKTFADYNNLPEESRSDLERAFCARTFVLAFAHIEETKSLAEFLKEAVNV